ncbi:MAG: insulinase family protein [Gammaproteobacteria bacterium]
MNAPPVSELLEVAGFAPLRRQRVESLGIEFQEFAHRGTGARHVHLAAEDANNAFMAAFATVPKDSTGVAHILEHTTLCGSRRYPVRDPFFLMLRRSLNTFMNAFTSSDTTAYPFATQNRKDFDNLLSVYLDAVFFPRLDPLDFAQEGHRLEFADPADPSSPLEFKGVVYNEMKGAMSSPTAQLWHALTARLFPTTTYHWNSGGDPAAIPSLSYEALREFHRTHYHPSNAVFFTYGDIPAAEHQARIEELALSQFEPRPIDLGLADERRLAEPMRETVEYAIAPQDDPAGRTHVVLGWLLGRSNDLRTMMRLRLLEGVLLQNSAAPLRQVLETTGLGKAPSELCGLDDTPREAVFMCGLEGAEPEAADAVEALVTGVLERVAREGVPAGDVEAALHQMELAQREISSRLPYGLQLMQRMLPAVIHGADPLAALDIDPVLAELRAEAESARFVPSLVRRWLLDNPHRVRITMRPDRTLAERRQAEESAQLGRIAAELDAPAREAIRAQAQALVERQNRIDDLSVLPTLGLDDVPPDIRVPQGESRSHPAGPVKAYRAGTNGLVHTQVVMPIPVLEPDCLRLLSLYAGFLNELGCGGDGYLAMQARQSLTGRFSAHISVRSAADDPARLSAYLAVAGEGLARRHAEVADLLHTLFSQVRFDEDERLADLIAQVHADAEDSVTGRGHTLAALAAARGFAPTAWLSHEWSGLAAVRAARALDESFGSSADAVRAFAASLSAIHDRIMTAPRRFLVVAEPGMVDAVAGAVPAPWAPGAGAASPFTVPAPAGRTDEAWCTNTSVNFCARAYRAVPSAHPDAAAFCVLGHFLRDGFLHRAIREQGGAYGGGASYDSDSATFRFYSYRDPRVAETLADFERSLDWLQSEKPSERVQEAILGVIKDLDQPSSPAGECMRAYFDELHGRTPEFRRDFRRRVLAVTLADMKRVAAAWLPRDAASTAVIGSRESLADCAALGMTLVDL